MKPLRQARLLLYWGLPPVILYVIFSRIDVGRLVDLAAAADPAVIALGVFLVFPKIALGGARWHLLSHSYGCSALSAVGSLREYWLSLTYGAVVPGSLGSDAYRVAICGRQTGRFTRAAFVIALEKTAALASCALLVVGVYPLLRMQAPPEYFGQVLRVANWVLAAAIGVGLMAVLARRAAPVRRWMDFASMRLARISSRIERGVARKLGIAPAGADRTPSDLLLAAFSAPLLFSTLALSLAIHAIIACSSQIYFQGLGHDLPLVVNFFVAPLIMLVLALPISFGGIGVRESVYIVFFGAFGVPAETSLLASFCGLISVALGHLCGLALIYFRRRYGGGFSSNAGSHNC